MTNEELNKHADRLHDALQLMVDFVGDGCPDGSYGYCMTEARAALKGLQVVGVDAAKATGPGEESPIAAGEYRDPPLAEYIASAGYDTGGMDKVKK